MPENNANVEVGHEEEVETTDLIEMQEECASNALTDSSHPPDMPEGVEAEVANNLLITQDKFGVAMDLLQMTQSELFALGRSFELMLAALGGDRDRVGDAIYGAKTMSLMAVKESFMTPRAVLSLALFNGFRVLGHKSQDPEELRLFVETMAFKHLGLDITLDRVTRVMDAFMELMQQNVKELPAGSNLAWRKLLTYTGSCFRYINTTYGERLKVIQAYSFTHVLHGVVLYYLWVLLGFGPLVGYLVMFAFELSWELLENSESIIERYRQSSGTSGEYIGDSYQNIIGDLLACETGYTVSMVFHRILGKPWLSIVFYFVVEAGLLIYMRDSLTVTLLTLIRPNEKISKWQKEGVEIARRKESKE